MSRKGARYHQVPTLWHMGFGRPFDIMRKRKGDRKWRRLFYQRLTRSSARRWWMLKEKGLCIIRCDIARIMFESVVNDTARRALAGQDGG